MRLRLLVASLMLTTSVYASPVKYTCEDNLFTEGLAPSWEAILDMDYQRAELKSFTIKGETFSDFFLKSDEVNQFNKSKLDTDAPALAVFEKIVGNTNIGVVVFGKANGVKIGDVIFVSYAFADAFYCYKNGSLKDIAMTELRDSHNKRILKEQQGN